MIVMLFNRESLQMRMCDDETNNRIENGVLLTFCFYFGVAADNESS